MLPPNAPLRLHAAPSGSLGAHFRGGRAARAWASACWRGGLGGATVYDELVQPALLAPALRALGLDAALVVGGDWALVDPALCDRVVERWRESPDASPVVFSQAPPGLAGAVVSAAMISDLAQGRAAGDPFASIGGVLGYNPLRPRTDPIASSACVQLEAPVRQCAQRFVPDSPERRAVIESVLATGAADARTIVRAADTLASERAALAPEELILDLTERRTGDERGDARDTPTDLAIRVVRAAGALNPALVLSLGSGAGDPLLHEGVFDIIAEALGAGLPVHVRTELLCAPETVERLASSGAEVVSIDLHAGSRATYHAIRGLDAHDRAMDNTARLLRARRTDLGVPRPFVVPRLLKRDAVYSEVEGFIDRAFVVCGWGVLDQLPAPERAERLEPLGKAREAARRDWRARLRVSASGAVLADERNPARAIADLREGSVPDAWRVLAAHRLNAVRSGGDQHPDLWTGW